MISPVGSAPRRRSLRPALARRPGGRRARRAAEQAPAAQRAMLADRLVQLHAAGLRDAVFELAHEDAQLSLGRRPAAAPGAREAIPGAREGEQVGAPAETVRGEHRAHAASTVDVGARDHALVATHARQHRFARGERHAVDREAQPLDGVLVWRVRFRIGCSPAAREGVRPQGAANGRTWLGARQQIPCC